MRLALVLITLCGLLVGPASAQDLDQAIAQLGSPDAETRARAACTISRFRAEGSAAVPALISILNDGTVLPHDVCKNILGQRWRFQRGWDRPGTSPSQEAAHALGHIGRAALDPLHRLVASGDVPQRLGVVRALREIEDPTSVPVLTNRVTQESNAEVRAAMAGALGSIEEPDAIDALGTLIGDRDIIVREQAAWALGAIESRRGVSKLLPALADASPVVREMAAWALGAIEDPAAVSSLIPLLGDSDPAVREQTAWALGSIGDEAASEALIALMDDRDVEVRRMAVWALSEMD
ncbi:MAG: HEAT repeat domain-containing protein [Rhodothermales bacterium]|nr:HEAT repeat domain-containing protein [Rhodothermales bacterium]